ncbi:MAG: 3-hydroxybutyryl-CoA dehydrogenase [Oscillospiraceae bacterium]|nr:3-hydroxybutyryl-CoA dehydrogenase [Oscillospiraceae bacterium]
MKVMVVGAGTMGSGIAQVFAQWEEAERVYLADVDAALAENGKRLIAKTLARLVAKERLSQEQADAVLDKLVTGTKEIGADADWVIEAAIEDVAAKKRLLRELDGIVREDAVFATNTSSLSITELSAGLNHTLIGMHFFNPAPVMKLVEIISGALTPQNVAERAEMLAKSLGKEPVRVKEAPGFVVNRLLIPMINEAVFLLSEGVASAEDIDTAMRLGANHPMGPLALCDLIGLDVVLTIMQTLQAETGDDKYRPAPLLRKMVRAGKLGRKSGEGFFSYK